MTARTVRSLSALPALAAAAAGYLLLVGWLSLVRFPYMTLFVWPGAGRRGMIASCLLHMAAVLILSFCVLHQEEVMVAFAAAVQVSMQDEPGLEPVVIAASNSSDARAADAADEAYSAIEADGAAEVVMIDVDSPVDAMISDKIGGSPLGEGYFDHVTEGKKLGGGDEGEGGEGGPDRATFFGTTAYGNKFVFIIDKSGSMEGTAFYRARGELLRSLKQLRDGQAFSIVFYNTNAFPFATDLVPRDRKSYQAANYWVGRMGPGGGTDPLSSLRIAMNMNPDAIFLLTDGEFTNPDAVYDLARAQSKPVIPVHTICFTNRHGEAVLKAIAKATNGTYRYVP